LVGRPANTGGEEEYKCEAKNQFGFDRVLGKRSEQAHLFYPQVQNWAEDDLAADQELR